MNTLGTHFKITSFGESHGSHVGCVIDGCPAGLAIDMDAIQQAVDRRKTNQSSFTSERKEKDIVDIISGLYQGITLGSPICILIRNEDAQSKDYEALKNVFRPSHADYTNQQKYGIRDERGGGRSSIRITAPLVAAGAIAKQLVQYYSSMEVTAFVRKIGSVALLDTDYHQLDFTAIEQNTVRCPDEVTAKKMIQHIEETKVSGDTLGGVIECVVRNMVVGLGEPIFGKLQSMLANAMMSINTVKGFEFGDGFDNANLKGSESNDAFTVENDLITTTTNHSGGIQGGISNGQDIVFRLAFKPISSISQKQNTVDNQHQKIELQIQGRHDTCAVPRAVPIVEAYTYLVLADAYILSKLSKI